MQHFISLQNTLCGGEEMLSSDISKSSYQGIWRVSNIIFFIILITHLVITYFHKYCIMFSCQNLELSGYTNWISFICWPNIFPTENMERLFPPMTEAIDVSPILQINNKKHLCRFKNWEISRLACPAAIRNERLSVD